MDKTDKHVKVYIKPNVLGPSLEIQNAFKQTDIIDGFPIENFTALDVEDLIKRLDILEYFKNAVHENGGFFFNDEWHYITKEVPSNSSCHLCGVPNNYGGVGMKMYKNKPTCMYCRMGLEKRESGDNIRP